MITKDLIESKAREKYKISKTIKNIETNDIWDCPNFITYDNIALLPNMIYMQEYYKVPRLFLFSNEDVAKNVFDNIFNAMKEKGDKQGLGAIIDIKIDEQVIFKDIDKVYVTDLRENEKINELYIEKEEEEDLSL